MLCSVVRLATVLILLSAHDAVAAVRQCTARVASGEVSANTLQQAKRAALQAWRAQAGKSGIGWDSWRLADGKSIDCVTLQTGVRCQAAAAPCIVDQTPNTPPR